MQEDNRMNVSSRMSRLASLALDQPPPLASDHRCPIPVDRPLPLALKEQEATCPCPRAFMLYKQALQVTPVCSMCIS